MAHKVKFSDLFENKETHREILKYGLLFLVALELIVFLWADFQAGTHATIGVYDAKGNKIYETRGKVMTTYEREIFQHSYGPLSNYRVQMETREVPFPFRAWLAVAVGVPIGVVLLLNYLIKAYLIFLGGEEEKTTEDETAEGSVGKLKPWFEWRKLTIYPLGFLVVVGLILLWMLPNFMVDVTRGVASFVLEFKWFFLGVVVFFALLLVWVIYLRYKMSQKMMDHQVDLEKFRVEKKLLAEHGLLALPEGQNAQMVNPQNRIETGRTGQDDAQQGTSSEDITDATITDADNDGNSRQESRNPGQSEAEDTIATSGWASRLLKRQQ